MTRGGRFHSLTKNAWMACGVHLQSRRQQTARTSPVRSFFGVSKISESPNGRYRLLVHGTTVHGGQLIRDENGKPVTGRPVPTTYYFDGSGMTQVIRYPRNLATMASDIPVFPEVGSGIRQPGVSRPSFSAFSIM